MAGVAVVDEQRIYDPNDQDDKLLLELKGAMSEAEIHWLRRRLQGARQHEARRGALRLPAPTGYRWGERGFEMNPDEAVQRAVRVIFQRCEVEPSARAVVRWARQTGFQCPTRRTSAEGDSAVEWKALDVSRLHEMLTNPVYAGVYAYGRRRAKTVLVDGQIRRVRPDPRDPDRWLVKLESAASGLHHVGEIRAEPREAAAEHDAEGGPESRCASRRTGPVEWTADLRSLRRSHGAGVRARRAGSILGVRLSRGSLQSAARDGSHGTTAQKLVAGRRAAYSDPSPWDRGRLLQWCG